MTQPRRSQATLLVIVTVAVLPLMSCAVNVRPGQARPSAKTERVATSAATLDHGLDILKGPRKSWSLPASEILEGSTYATVEPVGDGEVPVPAAARNALVVRVLGPSGSGSDLLAGVDANTGKLLWRRDDGALVSCRTVLDKTRFACWSYGRSTLVLVSPRTGKTVSTVTLPGNPEDVTSDSTSIYTAGFATGDDHHLFITKGTDLAPAATWKHTYTSAMTDPPQEPLVSVQLSAGALTVRWNDRVWLVDPPSGQRLAEGTRDHEPVPGGYFVNYSQDVQPYSPGLTDLDGNVIIDDSDPVDAPFYNQTGPAVRDGRVGFGSTLYDVSTGAPVWSRPELASSDATGMQWTPDGRQIEYQVDESAGSGIPALTVLDAATGKTQWTSNDTSYADKYTATARITIDSSDLQVQSRTTGKVGWSRQFESDSVRAGLAITDQSVVANNSITLDGFTDFATLKGTRGSDGGTDYVTACGSEPTFTPVTAVDANGGITVTVKVHAVCPSGQWLNSSGMRISLKSGDEVYADGTFDFSQAPYWVPGSRQKEHSAGGTTGDGDEPLILRLVYPYSTTYGTADEVQRAIGRKQIIVPCKREEGAKDGDTPADPSYGADPTQPVTAAGSGSGAKTAADDALAALRRIAASDKPHVISDLEGHWMPQLSSKKQGTADDGIVYTYDDILAEHLRLRARYDDVRLVFSSDWKSFLVPGFWVTLVGQPADDWNPALRWCTGTGFDRTHCYAKRLLRDGPSENSTKHVPAAGG